MGRNVSEYEFIIKPVEIRAVPTHKTSCTNDDRNWPIDYFYNKFKLVKTKADFCKKLFVIHFGTNCSIIVISKFSFTI